MLVVSPNIGAEPLADPKLNNVKPDVGPPVIVPTALPLSELIAVPVDMLMDNPILKIELVGRGLSGVIIFGPPTPAVARNNSILPDPLSLINR